MAGLLDWRQFEAAAGRACHCLCIPHHPSQWLPGNRAVTGPATAPGLLVRIAQGPLPRRASPLRGGQNGGGQQPRVNMLLGTQLLDTQNRARDADLSRQRNHDATTPALVDHDSRPCIKQWNELWSRVNSVKCAPWQLPSVLLTPPQADSSGRATTPVGQQALGALAGLLSDFERGRLCKAARESARKPGGQPSLSANARAAQLARGRPRWQCCATGSAA